MFSCPPLFCGMAGLEYTSRDEAKLVLVDGTLAQRRGGYTYWVFGVAPGNLDTRSRLVQPGLSVALLIKNRCSGL